MKSLIPHFVQEKFLKGEHAGQLEAYTMFIDLSGFTALTESLMKEGNEGAEKLSDILNQIFSPMVKLVYQRGGFIPYFAGDAFTGIFPAKAAMNLTKGLLQTAQEMRQLFSQEEFKGIPFPIGIKIGLSHGLVDWGIVGQTHKAYYFRGPAIDFSANCQSHAKNLQIVIDQNLRNLVSEGLKFAEIEDAAGYYCWDDQGIKLQVDREAILFNQYEITADLLNQFLPKEVIEYQGRGEFRPVVSVFCSFEGVETHEELDEFACSFLDDMSNFSGYFKEIDFGDKGGLLVGFFGAPVSFENNLERALEFALNFRSDMNEGPVRFRMGITSGTAFTGNVGGSERFQYAAVGNRVNLAARLMTYGEWGEILVDEEVRKDRRYEFRHRGDIHYKGIEGLVPTYKLIGRRAESQTSFTGAFVGRNAEVDQMLQFCVDTLSRKEAGVVYLFGEAGVGKSRLSYEVRQKLQEKLAPTWYTCLTDQILQKPFNPFIYFLRNYFEQSPENAPEVNRSNFEVNFNWLLNDLRGVKQEAVDQIRKEVIRTKPILLALIGLKDSDSIWENLDARGRHQNTLAAIYNLFLAESLVRPLVIELEDALWLDSNSEQLLEVLGNRIVGFPIILLITARYFDDGSKPVFFSGKPLDSRLKVLEIDLNMLNADALRNYTEQRLKAPISEKFFEMLKRTTNGNPFYLEQLLEYFDESKLLEKVEGTWTVKDKNIKLSNSIQAILTARIDRLSALVKETVKAAAVIGREFEVPVLTEVMRNQGPELESLRDQIRTAEKGQIWRAVNELRYIFRHSLLREAVYDMQLRTRLRELHLLIAQAIEKVYADQLENHYVDLAFHYEHAEEKEKTREYVKKAGDHSRRNFQNVQALRFYNKLLDSLESEGELREKFHILIKKGRILELIGRWNDCKVVYEEAVQIAEDFNEPLILGRAYNAIGHLKMLQGKYDIARKQLEKAVSVFESLEDEFGISKVYGDLGNLYFRQGEYEAAKSYFTKSIRIGRQFPYSYTQAQIVANLGLAFMNQGKYEEGIRWQKEQLERTELKKDKQGMATLFTNMGIVYFEKGDYDAAGSCFEKGLELAEELGNKLLLSIGTGCLGGVYERKGDYDEALRLFELDLKLTLELGDKQGIAIARSLLGDLFSIIGRFDEAIEQLEMTIEISEELGYQKGLARAVNTMGDIHYFLENYPESLEYYDRAIQVTREISNRLVLGRSLAEKCMVLLEMDKLTEARSVQREAMQIAKAIENKELEFHSDLLMAQVEAAEGMIAPARQRLHHLLKLHPEADEQAEICYFIHQIEGSEKHREKSLKLFQKLFSETPKFIYKKRIDDLTKGPKST